MVHIEKVVAIQTSSIAMASIEVSSAFCTKEAFVCQQLSHGKVKLMKEKRVISLSHSGIGCQLLQIYFKLILKEIPTV